MPQNRGTIKLPVELDVNMKDIQAAINKLQGVMGKLTPDSKAYQITEKEIAKLQKQLDSLNTEMRRGFQTPAQLNKFSDKVRTLGAEFETVTERLQHLSFDDLNLDLLPKEQLDKLKTLQKELENAQDRVDNFQTNKMHELLEQSDELSKVFKSLKLDLDTASYDKAVKASSKKLDDLQDKAQESLKRINAAEANQSRIRASVEARKHAKGIFNLNNTSYNNAYFQRDEQGNVTRFKSGGRKLLESQLEDWGLTPEQIATFRKTTVDQLSNFYETIKDTIEKSSNINKLDKKNEAAQIEIINAYKEQEEIKQVIESIQQLVNVLRQLNNIQDNTNPFHDELEQQKNDTEKCAEALKKEEEAIISNTHVAEESEKVRKEVSQSTNTMVDSTNEVEKATQRATDAQREFEQTTQNLNNAIKRWFGFREIVNLTKRAIRDAINHIKELDVTMTQIAVVTDMTTKDLWAQIGTYSAIAQQYGVTTNGVYQVSQLFYQQGTLNI